MGAPQPNTTVDQDDRQATRSSNPQPARRKETVEDAVYDWIIDLRRSDLPVTTLLIIAKALAIGETSRRGNIQLCGRQKLSGHLASVQRDFVACVMERFGAEGTLSGVSERGFVNMDETAVFFEIKTNQTVHPKGDRTTATRCSGSNAKRMTICVACASDGAKLPLMFAFKGKPDGRIDQSICDELPEGMIGCCVDKGRMDERSCRIWFENIWMPHVPAMGESLLLLSKFKYHMQRVFVNKLANIGTEVEYIPGGYTSVFQPCDVEVNMPFKKHIRDQYTKWTVEKLKCVDQSANVPAPSRKEVCH